MTQPEFVINERSMGVMGTDSKGNPKYFEKASFSITLLKHVEADVQDSGFLSLVKCAITGKDMYVTPYVIILVPRGHNPSGLCPISEHAQRNHSVFFSQSGLSYEGID